MKGVSNTVLWVCGYRPLLPHGPDNTMMHQRNEGEQRRRVGQLVQIMAKQAVANPSMRTDGLGIVCIRPMSCRLHQVFIASAEACLFPDFS
jgi:hypothetical protein